MARTKDGEITSIERFILMALLLVPDAKCTDIIEEIETRTNKSYSMPAIYLAIRSMRGRDFILMRKGEHKKIRGGRSRDHFSISADGKQALIASLTAIDAMRQAKPASRTANGRSAKSSHLAT